MPNEEVKIDIGDVELDETKEPKKKEKKKGVSEKEYNKVILERILQTMVSVSTISSNKVLKLAIIRF